MAFGGVKEYSLVHLNFDKGYYGIYFYEKDKRLTARQAWELIRGKAPNIKGEIGNKANIDTYWKLIDVFGLNPKHSDRYMTFRC
jgi:hypothetical protein